MLNEFSRDCHFMDFNFRKACLNRRNWVTTEPKKKMPYQEEVFIWFDSARLATMASPSSERSHPPGTCDAARRNYHEELGTTSPSRTRGATKPPAIAAPCGVKIVALLSALWQKGPPISMFGILLRLYLHLYAIYHILVYLSFV